MVLRAILVLAVGGVSMGEGVSMGGGVSMAG